MPSDFHISITNAPGDRAYPIASFTWVLIPRKTETEQKQRAMRQFLNWVLTSGQPYAEEAGFVRLPSAVIERELAVINKSE